MPEICMQCTALDGQGLLSSLRDLHHQGLEVLVTERWIQGACESHGASSADISAKITSWGMSGMLPFSNHQKMMLNKLNCSMSRIISIYPKTSLMNRNGKFMKIPLLLHIGPHRHGLVALNARPTFVTSAVAAPVLSLG